MEPLGFGLGAHENTRGSPRWSRATNTDVTPFCVTIAAGWISTDEYRWYTLLGVNCAKTNGSIRARDYLVENSCWECGWQFVRKIISVQRALFFSP